MNDPRLNSVHLDAPRREEYRRARALLLNARGWQTVAAERQELADDPHTLIAQPDENAPTDLKFWLVDRDYIYPLKVGLNTVGRAPDNDVVIHDAYVSRRHCAILVHAGDICEVHDTASKNGTYVNGRKIPGPTRLQTGDEIRMCDRRITFIAKDSPPDLPGHSPTLMAD
jgi:FHA domain